MQEYIDSEDLKRQWPRVGEYIDFIRNDILEKRDVNIDISCSLSLWGQNQGFDQWEVISIIKQFNDMIWKYQIRTLK